MASFAPNFQPNPENINDVFVHDFWAYSAQYEMFVPAGMNLSPIPQFNNKIVGFPNSVIERMSLNEYNTLVDNTATSIANTIWNNKRKSTDPIDEVDEKEIYAYLFLDSAILPDLTRLYDLAESGEPKQQALNNILKQLKKQQLDREDLLPKFTPAIDVNFDSNNLLHTYCRYEKNTNIFFDCNKCLQFESDFLSIMDDVGNPGLMGPVNIGPLFINTFARRRLPDRIDRQPMPNCVLCRKYVVYCNSDLGFGPAPFKTLIVEPVMEDLEYPDHAEFFYTLREAENFRAIKLLAGSKWICSTDENIDPPGIGEFPPQPKKCYEISSHCSEYFSEYDITIYNSLEECEENCGKKWYCVEYECVQILEGDPSVEGLTGYDTAEECAENCEIPTETPPSPTPTPS